MNLPEWLRPTSKWHIELGYFFPWMYLPPLTGAVWLSYYTATYYHSSFWGILFAAFVLEWIGALIVSFVIGWYMP